MQNYNSSRSSHQRKARYAEFDNEFCKSIICRKKWQDGFHWNKSLSSTKDAVKRTKGWIRERGKDICQSPSEGLTPKIGDKVFYKSDSLIMQSSNHRNLLNCTKNWHSQQNWPLIFMSLFIFRKNWKQPR